MNAIYRIYLPGDEIPVYDHVKNRKLVKYYTRETMAAVVTLAQFLEGKTVPSDRPFFYSSGETETLDFYREICNRYAGVKDKFSSKGFIDNIVPTISPLQQFKMMRNSTFCFLSIEHGLKGDNALFLASASGLLYSAILAETEGPVLIGAGKQHADGTVECGFAEVVPGELVKHPLLGSDDDALAIFKTPYHTAHVSFHNRY
jgi:hypothetical protein